MDATTFSALAEPTRLRIIELLRIKSYSVNDFAKLLDIRQPQASKHLHTLQRARLINMRPHAQQRIYSLNSDAFYKLEEWSHSFSEQWNSRLDNLDTHLNTINKKG